MGMVSGLKGAGRVGGGTVESTEAEMELRCVSSSARVW